VSHLQVSYSPGRPLLTWAGFSPHFTTTDSRLVTASHWPQATSFSPHSGHTNPTGCSCSNPRPAAPCPEHMKARSRCPAGVIPHRHSLFSPPATALAPGDRQSLSPAVPVGPLYFFDRWEMMLAKPADDMVTRPSVPEFLCPASGNLPQEHGVAGICSSWGGSSERHTEVGTIHQDSRVSLWRLQRSNR